MGRAAMLAGLALGGSMIMADTSWAQGVRTQEQGTSPARHAALRAILDEHVDWLMRENPTWASTRGDDRFADRLRDESPEAYARREAAMRDRLARVQALDRAGMAEADQLDADLLIYELRLQLDLATLHPEQTPVDAMSGPHVWLPQLADRTPLRTGAQRAGYVARLEAMPAHLAQITEQMRRGLEAGRTPPRVVLRRAAAQAREQGSAAILADATRSPFYKPFAASDAGSPDADPAELALAARARDAIAKGVAPAFAAFADFLEKEYVPGARESIGISQGVDGPRAYELALREHTTTSMTPAQVHELGLREVASLRAEFLATIAETDYPHKATQTGDELFAGFLRFIRDGDRFYWSDGEAMMRDYRELCKRIDPELPALFRTLPRNTYGVREIPAFAARTSPVAYYYPGSARSGVPGYFMVNTFNLRQRPRYGAVSLTIHEAVPGHHFQIALADELAESGVQHEFRGLLGYTAYVEGWALYSERLGLEMAGGTLGNALDPARVRPEDRGFYRDPYDNIGRLSDELWRACRLVVDTGIHAMGWERERAIAYLLANTAITEVDAASEVDRYIGWPGQACAYKIGQLEILRLRALAQQRLGERFDIRSFHDAVLLTGAVPLPVLEQRVERWIAAQ